MNTKYFGWVAAVIVGVLGFSSFAYAISAFIVPQGGTGWTNITANTILLGNGTGRLGTTTAGTNGQYLMLFNQVPRWVTATSSAVVSWGNITGTLSSQADLDAKFSTKIGTTSALVQSGVLFASGFNTVQTTSTTTLSGSGVITVTAGASVLGSSPITVACATCSTTLGTVTSVTGGTGLNGGAITAAGTLSLRAYFGTTTADTIGQVLFWSSTNGTPATFSSSASFTFSTTSNIFTVTSASTTNLSVSNFLQVPTGTTQSPTVDGEIEFDTTDDQLKIGDGSATQVYTQYRYIVYPMSTTTAWTGTTTPIEFVLPAGTTIDSVSCTTVPTGSKLNAQLQWGGAPTLLTMFSASSTSGNIMRFTSNNVITAGATTTMAFGTPTGSPTGVSCTATARITGT
jgi:hypothetical protein